MSSRSTIMCLKNLCYVRLDRFVDLSRIRPHLAEFYSHTGPSIFVWHPELLIRMLLLGIASIQVRSARLCEEVHLNLAYRWFCRLDCLILCPTTRRFPKEPTRRRFAIAICCAIYSRRLWRAALRDGLVEWPALCSRCQFLIEADANKQNFNRPERSLGHGTIKPEDARARWRSISRCSRLMRLSVQASRSSPSSHHSESREPVDCGPQRGLHSLPIQPTT